IDIRDPAQSYSAADFRRDCIRLVPQICARGALPVICGGTMMYYKALCDGLSPLPPTDPQVRARIAAQAQELGWPAMHQRLAVIDPPLYQKLAPNDRQRVSRAIEVYEMTGRPLSSFYGQKGEGCPFLRAEVVLLPKDGREELRKAIRARFLRMLDDGLLSEVEALRRRGDLDPSMPSMRAVGYRQAWEHLDGKSTRSQMIERAVVATARLAKHQMTWLRGGLSSDGCLRRVVLEPSCPDGAAEAARLASELDEAASAGA
ncbi:MAG: tRNA (adenosine(37)-N6)-dimethylallyltransferase MiaA, partial [Succinivibrio sp.]